MTINKKNALILGLGLLFAGCAKEATVDPIKPEEPVVVTPDTTNNEIGFNPVKMEIKGTGKLAEFALHKQSQSIAFFKIENGNVFEVFGNKTVVPNGKTANANFTMEDSTGKATTLTLEIGGIRYTGTGPGNGDKIAKNTIGVYAENTGNFPGVGNFPKDASPTASTTLNGTSPASGATPRILEAFKGFGMKEQPVRKTESGLNLN